MNRTLTVGIALLIAVTLTIACRTPCPSSAISGKKDICVKGETMKGYATRYANGSNTSRVGAHVRHYSALESFASMGAADGDTARAPELVLVDPSGDHVAVVRRSWADLFDRHGLVKTQAIMVSPEDMPFVTNDVVISSPKFCKWDGTCPHYEPQSAPYGSLSPQSEDRTLAVRLIGERWISILQEGDSWGKTRRVYVSSADITAKAHDGTRTWLKSLPGDGVGAIADDGRVAIVMDTGALSIFAAEGRPKYESITLVQTELGEGADFLTAVGDGLLLLTRRGGERPIRVQGEPLPEAPSAKSTLLRAVDARGNVAWSAEVPFEALEPAVDSGVGRVYVVGWGIAAVERGVVLWSMPSKLPMQATAFADGTLAVCVGRKLQIVEPGGTIRQELTVPDAGPIRTLPAIGPDGAIWIATKAALYVAR